MLNKNEVEHIAELARLELTDAEKQEFQSQLGDILDYVEKLAEIDAENVSTADGGTHNLQNIWRKDNNKNAIDSEDLKKYFPESEHNQNKVKSIL
jgi:aspartyl-tRNA(Asn)/glutamyl-tRNA(Gln) amidotransferase subunit C